MEPSVILGSYHSGRGGRIYLNLSENLVHQSMGSTCIHEMSHAWLSGTTALGFLCQVMQMEALLAEPQSGPASCRRSMPTTSNCCT